MDTSTHNPAPRLHFYYGYIIVALSYVVSVVVFGILDSFGVFFNPMLDDFGWSKAFTSGAFAISSVAQGVSGIFFGRFTDKFGPRLVLTGCGFLLGVGYILMSRITNGTQFYLVYGLMIGIGVGGFWVPLLSTISRWFYRKRGLMVGIFVTGAGVGASIFPPIISWLIQSYDWRLASIVIGVTILVVCILLSQFITRDPSQRNLLVDGDNVDLRQVSNPDDQGYSISQALSTRQFWMIMGVFFCFGWCFYTIIVHIVPFALYSGISAATAANILAVSGIFKGVGSFVSGLVADRLGVKKVALVCIGILAASLSWLLFFQSVWQLYLFAACLGFAEGGAWVVEMLGVVWLFGLKANAFILGAVEIGAICGTSAGPVIAGYIYDATGSYQIAFMICVFLSLAALLLMFWIKPETSPQSNRLDATLGDNPTK